METLDHEQSTLWDMKDRFSLTLIEICNWTDQNPFVLQYNLPHTPQNQLKGQIAKIGITYW